jgi:hypothetical protein
VDQIKINAIDSGRAQGKTRILRLLTTKNDRGYQRLADPVASSNAWVGALADRH